METDVVKYFHHDTALVGDHVWNKKPLNGPSLKREISFRGVLFVNDSGVDFNHTTAHAKDIIEDLIKNPRESIISGFTPVYLAKAGFRAQSDDRMFADKSAVFKGDDEKQIWASVIEADNR